jgi:hypothetical protein
MTIGNASVKTLVLETMARNIALTLVKLLLFQQLDKAIEALGIPKLCTATQLLGESAHTLWPNKNVLKMGQY